MKHDVNRTWIVAFNIHTKEWSSGGRADHYDPAHWDRYAVAAHDRNAAEKAAKALRKKQMAMTQRQRDLLGDILAAIPEDKDPLSVRITVDPDEERIARQLARKGLVEFHDATSEASLLLQALNYLRRNEP